MSVPPNLLTSPFLLQLVLLLVLLVALKHRSGAHRRDITGAFWSPERLLHFDGRLYVVESYGAEPDGISEEEKDKIGRRIFVLIPQGETLQVYDMPEGGRVDQMAVVDRKLLVHYSTHVYALLGA